MGRPSHRVGIGLLFALLSLSGPAAAAHVVVSYQAAPPCPSRPSFIDEIRRRTERVRSPGASQEPWRISVQLRPVGELFEGQLRLQGPDGSATVRNISSTRCGDVASALALIAAIAIESTGETDPAVPEPRVATSPWTGADEGPRRDAGGLPFEHVDGSWVAGLQGVSMGAFAPGYSPGGAVMVGYEPTVRVLDLRLRLAAVWMPAKRVDVDDSAADIGWTGLRLDTCPVRVANKDVALLAPCATAAVGRLHATGRFDGGSEANLTWADVGVAAHLEIVLLGPWFADMHAAAIAPLTHNDLVFDGPRVVAHETPALGALVSAGLGLRFP